MKLMADYHTHTIYSKHNHGKGSVLENAEVASQKGLVEIAITDHGFKHKLYGLQLNKLEYLKSDIKKAKAKTGINILCGVETNLLGADGSIDLLEEQEAQFDVILMGYHKMAKSKALKDWWNLHFINDASRFLHFSKKRIQQNTDAYLRAIDKNNIDVITHLNYGMPVDSIQIASLAIQKNTYIELNGKRTIFTPEELDIMVRMKTHFLINSDAHSPNRVGECNLPTNICILNNIPTALIGNINKLPKFKNHKR